MAAATPGLSAPYVLEYAYRRSVGPVLGRFFAALREGRILGARTAAGRVLVPPAEWDPESGEPITGELVEVGSAGVVTAWTWVEGPEPFAWALVKLDGADTAMLHKLDAKTIDRVRTGARVRARWRAERKGEIQDLACFELEGGAP